MAIFEYRVSQIPANVNYKALQNIGKYQDISVKSQPNTIGYPLALKLSKSVGIGVQQLQISFPWRMALTSGIGFPSYVRISVQRRSMVTAMIHRHDLYL